MNTFPGHSAPAIGFEAPLEMLAACHGRVQQQCETLLRLLAHLQDHGPDRPAQEAARAVMRYFDTAARHHHEDEEHDLFPALLESMAGSDAVCVREMTAALCNDHRALERRWADVRVWLLQVADGAAATLEGADVPGFVRLYEEHIAREEAELLPMAARLPPACRALPSSIASAWPCGPGEASIRCRPDAASGAQSIRVRPGRSRGRVVLTRFGF